MKGWKAPLTALDRNVAVLHAVRERLPMLDVFACDVTRDDLPNLRAHVVVADPPWYPRHAMSFLWACSRVVRLVVRPRLAPQTPLFREAK